MRMHEYEHEVAIMHEAEPSALCMQLSAHTSAPTH